MGDLAPVKLAFYNHNCMGLIPLYFEVFLNFIISDT